MVPGAAAPCRKPRRAKIATLLFVELLLTWLNTTFFIIPNAFWLATYRSCRFFSNIVRERSPAYDNHIDFGMCIKSHHVYGGYASSGHAEPFR